jgi:hypothetical protein
MCTRARSRAAAPPAAARVIVSPDHALLFEPNTRVAGNFLQGAHPGAAAARAALPAPGATAAPLTNPARG